MMNSITHSEQEINKIRVELYNETKGMTDSEINKRANETAKRIAKQYNLTILKKS